MFLMWNLCFQIFFILRLQMALHNIEVQLRVKDEVEFWSCDCIVKETVWNRPEKVDHLAYKNVCVLQGSGIIQMIRNWPSLGKVTNTVHRKMYMGLHEHVA